MRAVWRCTNDKCRQSSPRFEGGPKCKKCGSDAITGHWLGGIFYAGDGPPSLPCSVCKRIQLGDFLHECELTGALYCDDCIDEHRRECEPCDETWLESERVERLLDEMSDDLYLRGEESDT